MRTLFITAVLGLATLATPAAAADVPAGEPVAVVVSIPTPPSIDRATLEAGIRRAVPDYRRVPGLLRKYFTAGAHEFGGVYLFTTRAAAQAWFGPAWHARIAQAYHATATITYYDVPVVLDNAAVPASAQAQP